MQKFKVNYHASVCLGGDVYVDPLNIKGRPLNAKVVLITHSHWDHLSVEDVKKVANEKTHFVAPQDCIDMLKAEGFKLVDQNNHWAVGGKSYKNGDEKGYKIPNTDIWVQAFPSYNIGKKFHPKESMWVGYIVTIDDVRYVICGDCDFTPELAKIKCDVLFVPIGGTYTMNAKEAAECVNKVKPEIVVPIHYLLSTPDGTVLGSRQDEKKFITFVNKGIKVKTFF